MHRDLLLHIRLIHFSAVVIAVALFCTILFSRAPEAERAWTSIRDIIELKNAEPYTDLESLADTVCERSPSIPMRRRVVRERFRVPNGHQLLPDDWEFGAPNHAVYWDHEARELLAEYRSRYRYSMRGGAPFDKTYTLQEFADLWNGLAVMTTCMCVTDHFDVVVLYRRDTAPRERVSLIQKFSITPSASEGPTRNNSNIYVAPTSFRRPSLEERMVLRDSHLESNIFLKIFSTRLGGAPLGDNLTELPKGSTYELAMPAKAVAMRVSLQNVLITRNRTRFRTTWQTGRFEESFPELAEASALIRDLPVEKARDILAAEMRRSGDRFEAFGARVPHDALGQVGPFVLLAVQLYLLLHLRQLARQSEIAVGSAEWIGAYKDRLAGTITYITAAGVPPSVVLAVVFTVGRDAFLAPLYAGASVLIAMATATVISAVRAKLR